MADLSSKRNNCVGPISPVLCAGVGGGVCGKQFASKSEWVSGELGGRVRARERKKERKKCEQSKSTTVK